MNPHWKVILTFVAVFAAGAVCGGPIADWIRERQQQNRPPFAERTLRRFERELELSSAQKEKIYPILLAAQKNWRQLRQDNVHNLTSLVDRMHADVSAELNPEQRAKLETLRKEFRARAERFRGDRRTEAVTPPSS